VADLIVAGQTGRNRETNGVPEGLSQIGLSRLRLGLVGWRRDL